MTATFIELTRNHRDVLAVRFDMNRGLDDSRTLYMYWNGEAFRPLSGHSASPPFRDPRAISTGGNYQIPPPG